MTPIITRWESLSDVEDDEDNNTNGNRIKMMSDTNNEEQDIDYGDVGEEQIAGHPGRINT